MGEQRYRGTIRRFNVIEGFGFIAPDEGCGTADMFVHERQLEASGIDPAELRTGDWLSYEVEMGRQGKLHACRLAYEVLHGKVKWFSVQKGFGFIAPDKGSGMDTVFLPAYQLEESGIDPAELAEDDWLTFGVQLNTSGRPRACRLAYERLPQEILGEVKWFSVSKGYGFISPKEPVELLSGGGVFVHVSALEESGIDPVLFTEGVLVSFDLARDAKGRLQAWCLVALTEGAEVSGAQVLSLAEHRAKRQG